MFRRPEFLGSLWGLGAVALFVCHDTAWWIRIPTTAAAYLTGTLVGMAIGLIEANQHWRRGLERLAEQRHHEAARNTDADEDGGPIILPMPRRNTTNQTAS